MDKNIRLSLYFTHFAETRVTGGRIFVNFGIARTVQLANDAFCSANVDSAKDKISP